MTTSSEETVRVRRYVVTGYDGSVREATDSDGGECYVVASAYDAVVAERDALITERVRVAEHARDLVTERDRLRQRAEKLEAVAKQYAGECGECGGTGEVRANSYDLTMTGCNECAFIRLALSGEK